MRPQNHNPPTPLGAVRELIIESPPLSSTGYMNRPEASDKFILSPSWLRDFRDGHSGRLYKTGDLVRYMERLETKEVRHRIQEPLLVEYRAGEIDIDHVLQQHLADMKEKIARHISTSLPKYMISSMFLAITNIPITSNGKADRRVLKAFVAQRHLGPDLLRSGNGTRATWSDIQLFELGGGSLAAIKLASAARHLGHNLSAQVIFKTPVLSAMAAQVVALKETITSDTPRFDLLGKIGLSINKLRNSLAVHNIDEQNVEDAYPLTRQQQRYMEGKMISPGGTTRQHIMPLPATMDLVRLAAVLRRVVRANALLRTRIILVSSRFVQVVLKEDNCACRRVEAFSLLVSEDRKADGSSGQAPTLCSTASPEGCYWKRSTMRITTTITRQNGHNATDSSSTYDIKVPGITHTLSLGIEFPAALPAELSYSTVMREAWAMVAALVEERDHFLFNILLGDRDAEFTGIDRLMGPASTTAPLATNIDNESIFRENVELVQKRIDEAGSVQNLVRLGDKLHQMLAAVPVIVVHPPDDYEEAGTKHLGLFRSRVEAVQPFVDATFMNFCLQPGNAEVDLIMAIESRIFAEDKAIRYFECLEQVLTGPFSPGDLNLTITAMSLDRIMLTSSVLIAKTV
ncbi:hypothetical protein F4782DRAFT_533377 [Xylaria castorea]|nr:hypothetical protein F4782DRAFT_533377 [Xylaria castorea]